MKPRIRPIPAWGPGWHECRGLGVVGTGRTGPDAYRDWAGESYRRAEKVKKEIDAWRRATA